MALEAMILGGFRLHLKGREAPILKTRVAVKRSRLPISFIDPRILLIADVHDAEMRGFVGEFVHLFQFTSKPTALLLQCQRILLNLDQAVLSVCQRPHQGVEGTKRLGILRLLVQELDKGLRCLAPFVD